MNTPKYSGAYSRRRYSNAAASDNSLATAHKIPVQPGSTFYTLDARSADPSKGAVTVADLSATATGQTAGHMDYGAFGNSGQRFAAGSVVEIMAKSHSGYRFAGWETTIPGRSEVRQNPIRVTINGNYQVVAKFASIENNHTLAVAYDSTMGNVTANGLAPEPGYPDGNGMMRASMSVRYGNSVTLTAIAKQGYKFVCWQGCDVAGKHNMTVHQSQLTQQVFRNLSLQAVFEPEGGGTGGGTGGDNPPIGPTPNPNPGPSPTPNPSPSPAEADLVGKAVAFAKQWWWAILIVGYIAYKELKGGRQ